MAKLTGGLHGRPAGNVGGIVYGAARTRQGKVTTARELVIPSNPNSGDQQNQRSQFSNALYPTRYIGKEVWTNFFNRSVGQLPGFQSLMSIFIMNQDTDFILTPPPVTPIGDLHFPDSFTAIPAVGEAAAIDVSWSSEIIPSGSDEDLIHMFAVANTMDSRDLVTGLNCITTTHRSAESETFIALSPAQTYILAVWFEGQGDYAGKLSPVHWYEVDSSGAL